MYKDGGMNLLSLVFITSLFLMFLEFVLIRVYSFVTFPPLGFWIVSISMMGSGFGAAVAYIFKKSHEIPFSLLFSVSICMIFLVVTQIPLTEPILSEIFLHSFVLSLPFFFGGSILSYTFKFLRANEILFWSYVGSISGVVLAFILIPHLGAESSLIFTSLFPFLVSLLRKNKFVIIGVMIALMLIFSMREKIDIAEWLAKNYPDQIYPKRIFNYIKKGWKIIYTKWDMLMRVDVIEKNDWKFVLYDGKYEIGINTTKLTLSPCLFRNYSTALIIGSGTGADVDLVKRIVGQTYAVEISGTIVDLAEKMSSAYDGVEVEKMDGRKFIKITDKKFDLIAFPLVDFPTSTTNIDVENYLTTVEGFEDFLSHLNTNGILCLAHHKRVIEDYLPSAIPALNHFGLNLKGSILIFEKEQESCIEKLYGHACENMTYLIIKKGEFTSSEITAIKELIMEVGSSGSNFWNQTKLENYLETHMLFPMTDDRPYPHRVFDSKGWESGILMVSLIISVLFFATSFLLVKNHRLMLGSSLIGFGYMLTETAIVQKSLVLFSTPSFTLAVVLLSFLLFNGIGTMLSTRLRNKKTFLLFFAPLSIICFYYVLNMLNTDFFHKNIYLMIGSFLLGISPVGIFLGMVFPHILKKCTKKERPLLYATDAVFSTLGGGMALFISVFLGFKASFLVATLSYLIVLLFVM